MKKKILCVAMAMSLIAGLVPVSAYASETIKTLNNEETGTVLSASTFITDTAADSEWEWKAGSEIAVGSTIQNDTSYDLEIIYVRESVTSMPTGVEMDTITAGSSKVIAASEKGITTAGNWKVCGNRKGGVYGEPVTNGKSGIVLYPTAIAEYKVTFQMNGQGTAPAEMTKIASGSKITAPTAPTAAGYVFGGWYKEAGCTNAWDFAADTVTADTILYAKWTPAPAAEGTPVITAITSTGAVYGYAEGTAKTAVTVTKETGYTYTYQWYSNTENKNSGGTAISGATAETYTLPAGKTAGNYYFYCEVTASKEGQNSKSVSNAATVTIEKKEIGITWSNTSFTYDGTAKIPTAAATGLVGTDTCAITVTGGQTNANAEGSVYTATASIPSDSNYKLPANPTTTFTIAKAVMTVTAADVIKAYDGSSHGITVNVTKPSSGYTVKYGETAGTYNLSESPKYSAYGTKTVYYQVIDNSNNYQTYTGTASVTIADTTAPTGSIVVGGKTYSGFVSSISFATYLSVPQKVTIDIEDNASGEGDVYYYLTETALTSTGVKSLASSKWTTYKGAFNLNSEKKYIVYAKLTDVAGYIRYISTDGLILDDTEPKIEGIKDGGKYCKSVSVTVTDTYLSTVTVDGTKKSVSSGKSTFTLSGDGKEHTIIAKDKAGNETEYTVTTSSSHKYEDFKQTKVEGEWSLEESKCEGCGQSYKRYRKNTEIMAEEDPSGGSIAMDVEVKTGAPSTSVKGLNTDVAKKLVSDAATRAAKGEKVLVYLNVSQQASVASTDKTATENAVKQSKVQNLKEGMYLDLSMYKKVGSTAATKISNVDLTNNLTFSMTLPETLKAPAGMKRTYYVVRIHNGTATVLNTTLKDNVISFDTDRFSTYSIWYTEEGTAVNTASSGKTTTSTGTKDSVPQTSDNNNSFWYGMLCLMGAMGTGYFGRKKIRNSSAGNNHLLIGSERINK